VKTPAHLSSVWGTLSEDEFMRDASKPGAHGWICRACDRERCRDYYARNSGAALQRVQHRARRAAAGDLRLEPMPRGPVSLVEPGGIRRA
jgi:hypothetical protein